MFDFKNGVILRTPHVLSRLAICKKYAMMKFVSRVITVWSIWREETLKTSCEIIAFIKLSRLLGNLFLFLYL